MDSKMDPVDPQKTVLEFNDYINGRNIDGLKGLRHLEQRRQTERRSQIQALWIQRATQSVTIAELDRPHFPPVSNASAGDAINRVVRSCDGCSHSD